MIRPVLFLAVSTLAFACDDSGPGVREVDRDEEVIDETPPTISHEHDSSPRTYQQPVYINADVTDEDSAVVDVKIVFQRETDGSRWKDLRMEPYPNGFYEGVIPGSDVTSGGIRYYIVAEDEAGNSGCLPEACEAEAWHFPVVPPQN